MVVSVAVIWNGFTSFSIFPVNNKRVAVLMPKECLLPKTVGCSTTKGMLHKREPRRTSACAIQVFHTHFSR